MDVTHLDKLSRVLKMQIEMPKGFEESQTKPANVRPRLWSVLRFCRLRPDELPFSTDVATIDFGLVCVLV